MTKTKTKSTKRFLNADALAKLIGASAAFMLFAQGGACLGRTFHLSRPNGRTVIVTMHAEGAVVAGDTSKQITEDTDTNVEA